MPALFKLFTFSKSYLSNWVVLHVKPLKCCKPASNWLFMISLFFESCRVVFICCRPVKSKQISDYIPLSMTHWCDIRPPFFIDKTLLLQPAVAFAIREQLCEVRILLLDISIIRFWYFFDEKLRYNFMHAVLCFQIAIQSVASAKETRINKKGRRGAEHLPLRFVCFCLDEYDGIKNVYDLAD